MRHLGDITAIDGHTAPTVDVVIGGSPCQGLSQAGKRAGLADARSGLFMEQIRVIKEMREADAERGNKGRFIRPRYMVWENVVGALSRNKGADFRAVLEETAKIADPSAVIPEPPKGKWATSGCVMGDGWSIAYRVLDAQFWGVPQRRRRIALIADFGRGSAPEIPFVRKSVCGDIEPGQTEGQAPAAGIGGGAGPAVARCLTSRQDGSPCIGRGPNIVLEPEDVAGTDAFCLAGNLVDRMCSMNGVGVSQEYAYVLNTVDRHAVCAGFKPHAGAGAGSTGYQPETSPTLATGKPHGVLTYDARGNGAGLVAGTLTGNHAGRVSDYTPLVMATGQANAEITADASPTLNCDREQPIVAAVDCRNGRESPEVNGTLQAKSTGGQSLNLNNVVRWAYTVRRLTELECERLQGFPDGWTDIGPWVDSKGKRHKECTASARYTALGNSIAIPPWAWVLKRLCACYERPATMASLFDGIGGFPLIWERLNGPGTCIWASEIDEFAMAVTKYRFQEEGKCIGLGQ